jgi:tRNA (cytidine/uridine-2'-O-)-methyltransferase
MLGFCLAATYAATEMTRDRTEFEGGQALNGATAIRLALYQPDIPQNTGTLIRLAACLGVAIDIIEPAGFTFSNRDLKRAALDYGPLAEIRRHDSWEAFGDQHRGSGRRLVLLTTRAALAYTEFRFRADDVLLLGRESAGVPAAVHEAAAARLRVPIGAEARSLNVAVAAAMVLGEALRQTAGWPHRDQGGEAG